MRSNARISVPITAGTGVPTMAMNAGLSVSAASRIFSTSALSRPRMASMSRNAALKIGIAVFAVVAVVGAGLFVALRQRENSLEAAQEADEKKKNEKKR